MLAVFVIACMLTAGFYYRAFGMLKRHQWQTLLGLRIFAILLIVLLLFQPVFSYYRDLEEQPAMIFLLDHSRSMSISDDASGIPRFQQARQQVESWWEKLKDDFNLRLIAFSERAEPMEGIEQLPVLAADGKATSLSRALVSAARAMPDREVEAVIMLSDGVHNSARNPLDVAVKMGMPVHTVGVGASLRSDVSYRDIQVTGINCPDRLMLNNKAKITASVEGVGLAGRVIEVLLEDDGSTIGTVELTLDDVQGSQEVEFEFRPTTKGRHTYTVSVPPVSEEKIQENNKRSAVALVIEPGIRVLYLEGTLRAEYGAIVDRFLSKDPDLEFCALIQTRPNVFLRRTNMEDVQFSAIPTDQQTFNMFDVFILGDLDSSYIRPEQQEMLIERVRQGGGLVMLGGYHSLGPGGYGESPLGEVLPVFLGTREVGQINDPFLPMLTPEGVRHPIFANIARYFPTTTGDAKESGLPMLDGCTRVEGAKPTATVLATCPVAVENTPVLAVQPVDDGRTAVFCGDTTRKWQQGPRALGQESPFLQFWGQLVRYLAGRSTQVEAKASITSSTDKGYYEPEEPIRISSVVRDERGEGSEDAKVVAKLRNPAGRPEEVELSAVPGPGGHYMATYEPAEPGKYEIVVQTRLGELTLEAEKLIVEVGRPNLEFEKLDLDDKMLSSIASDTGGRYVHITTADNLIDQLDRSASKKRVYFERKLYWPPLFWALFVGLLTVEWVLRKSYQLR